MTHKQKIKQKIISELDGYIEQVSNLTKKRWKKGERLPQWTYYEPYALESWVKRMRKLGVPIKFRCNTDYAIVKLFADMAILIERYANE